VGERLDNHFDTSEERCRETACSVGFPAPLLVENKCSMAPMSPAKGKKMPLTVLKYIK